MLCTYIMYILLGCPEDFPVCLLAFNTTSKCSDMKSACEDRGLSVVTDTNIKNNTLLVRLLKDWKIGHMWITYSKHGGEIPTCPCGVCKFHSVHFYIFYGYFKLL